jgi:ferric iron reductase protein FhuF
MTLNERILAGLSEVGRLAAGYPIYLSAPEDEDVVACSHLLTDDHLREYAARGISEWCDDPAKYPRPAASNFVRFYVASLTSALELPLAHGVAFDLSIPRVSLIIKEGEAMGVVLDTDGAPGWVDRHHPNPWPLPGAEPVSTLELRERAFATYFSGHVTPMIDQVSRSERLARRVLWAHVAEQIEEFAEEAMYVASDDVRDAMDAVRRLLLFSELIPGVNGPNPLLGRLRWDDFDDPVLPRPIQMRKPCCLFYLLPGGQYCRSCDLISFEQRQERWREWVVNEYGPTGPPGRWARPSKS